MPRAEIDAHLPAFAAHGIDVYGLFIVRGHQYVDFVDAGGSVSAVIAQRGSDREAALANALISGAQFADIEVPVPPIDEQRRIAEVLDTTREAIAATMYAVKKLRRVRVGVAAQFIDRGIGTLRAGPTDAPASWTLGRLGDRIHLQRGFDITRDRQRPGDIPVVSSGGVLSFHDEAMVDGPGVVIGRKGKLGDVYYVESAYWPHDTTLWVTDFGGNLPRYVAEMLKRLHLERLDAATSVPTLNRNVVHPLLVAIPPLDEQHRIVSVLDAIDARTVAETAHLEKLRGVRVGLAADLLVGRVRTTPR